MRLRTSLPFALIAAAPAAALVGLVLPPAPAHALSSPRPTCAAPDTRDFPIKTRIHGGPAAYEVGGDFGTWYIDLTNTTAHSCGDIHPVVVLVDQKRVLRPAQARLEFYEGDQPHAVTFETTDQAENVGAFDDGFPGFTVGPGRTLTVKVRLSLTSDATAPDDVVANAAVVQRRNEDGDWVGQSNDYRFRIEDENGDKSTPESGDETLAGNSAGADGGGVPDSASSSSSSSSSSSNTSAGAGTSSSGSSGDSSGGGSRGRGGGGRGGAHDRGGPPSAYELARTGPGAPHLIGVTVGFVLFGAGAVLLAASRRVRRR
ncbi:hypothetical protein [Streptomyces sp. NPDC058249]|uniref:hypothetical protein n=1 Tax=Streptomyces sp. NPDC058249 TaxID=3346403 RepID=UPI0036EFD6A4